MLTPAAPAVLAGLLTAAGAVLVLAQLLPTHPPLASALDRLSGAPPRPSAGDITTGGGWAGRVGTRLEPHVRHRRAVPVPHQDLSLLRTPVPVFLGHKTGYALLGLAFPPLLAAAVALAGLALPVALPAAGALGLAVALWFVPDLDTRRRAAAARVEFARAVTAFLDLTALERAAGSGASQALERAALIGDSWPFERLRHELMRARWTGTPPWHALTALAVELDLPELGDLAGIMRLSGEEGTAVYDTLRARSRGLRTALLTREQAAANADSERMVIPVALLGLVFLALLAYPALARVL